MVFAVFFFLIKFKSNLLPPSFREKKQKTIKLQCLYFIACVFVLYFLQGTRSLFSHACAGMRPFHLAYQPLLGNSGKPVTLETLSLTKFSKHVFQEQGIHDFQKPGACEASNSQMCEVRGSRFGEDIGSRTCKSSVSRTVGDSNFGGRPVRESVEGWVRGSRARTRANQRRNEGKFGNPLKTQFGSFMRRYSRTRREAKSKLLSQKVRV
jgi:hypothetical protein